MQSKLCKNGVCFGCCTREFLTNSSHPIESLFLFSAFAVSVNDIQIRGFDALARRIHHRVLLVSLGTFNRFAQTDETRAFKSQRLAPVFCAGKFPSRFIQKSDSQ